MFLMAIPQTVVTIDPDTNPEGTPILWVSINGETVGCVSQLGTKWLAMLFPAFCYPERQKEWASSPWEAVGTVVDTYQDFKSTKEAA